jgi:hypothetical protein
MTLLVLDRAPRLGEVVYSGSRRGEIDTVIRHESGDQVRVKWNDQFYRPFYDWSALKWDYNHWVLQE